MLNLYKSLPPKPSGKTEVSRTLPVHKSLRTSALVETTHSSQHGILPGATNSTTHADAIITQHSGRLNIRARVKAKEQQDYRTYNAPALLLVRQMQEQLKIAEPEYGDVLPVPAVDPALDHEGHGFAWQTQTARQDMTQAAIKQRVEEEYRSGHQPDFFQALWGNCWDPASLPKAWAEQAPDKHPQPNWIGCNLRMSCSLGRGCSKRLLAPAEANSLLRSMGGRRRRLQLPLCICCKAQP